MKLTEAQIDELVTRWHEGNSDLHLHEYLGFTEEQYAKWLFDASAIPEMDCCTYMKVTGRL